MALEARGWYTHTQRFFLSKSSRKMTDDGQGDDLTTELVSTSAAQAAPEKSKLCESEKAALAMVLQPPWEMSDERRTEALLTVSQPVRDVAIFALQRYAHCQSIFC
jgi:hypothetical protein